MPKLARADKFQVDEELLRRLYREGDGFIARVHEKLPETGIRIAYPTLTHRLRTLGISPLRNINPHYAFTLTAGVRSVRGNS